MAEVQKQDPKQSGEMAQRFVQFVMMQAQNILFVLGKIASPEGRMPPNLEAGKMLIDQLEMIKIKTEGNISAQEARILDQALSEVQLAFVEASGGTPASMMPSRGSYMPPMEEEEPFEEEPAPAPAAATPEAPKAAPASEAATPKAAEAEADDHKKKFFKSYG
jgi:hypothetical protein